MTYTGNKSNSSNKAVDFSPIEVSETASFKDVAAYPNPPIGDFTIAHTTGNATIDLFMFDVQGRIDKQD